MMIHHEVVRPGKPGWLKIGLTIVHGRYSDSKKTKECINQIQSINWIDEMDRFD